MARLMDNPLVASTTATSSGNSAAFKVPYNSDWVNVIITTTAVSGTTPSCTFSLQWSNDGTNWANADGTADSFAAVTAAGVTVKQFNVKGYAARLVWNITGTTPSFTFSATGTASGNSVGA